MELLLGECNFHFLMRFCVVWLSLHLNKRLQDLPRKQMAGCALFSFFMNVTMWEVYCSSTFLRQPIHDTYKRNEWEKLKQTMCFISGCSAFISYCASSSMNYLYTKYDERQSCRLPCQGLHHVLTCLQGKRKVEKEKFGAF